MNSDTAPEVYRYAIVKDPKRLDGARYFDRYDRATGAKGLDEYIVELVYRHDGGMVIIDGLGHLAEL